MDAVTPASLLRRSRARLRQRGEKPRDISDRFLFPQVYRLQLGAESHVLAATDARVVGDLNELAQGGVQGGVEALA